LSALRLLSTCVFPGQHSVQSVLAYNEQVVGSIPAAPTAGLQVKGGVCVAVTQPQLLRRRLSLVGAPV